MIDLFNNDEPVKKVKLKKEKVVKVKESKPNKLDTNRMMNLILQKEQGNISTVIQKKVVTEKDIIIPKIDYISD